MSAKEQNNLKQRVQQAIEIVAPHLQADGGGLELVDVSDDGVVSVRLLGACHGCPGARMTLEMGVARVIKQQVPEISQVKAV